VALPRNAAKAALHREAPLPDAAIFVKSQIK